MMKLRMMSCHHPLLPSSHLRELFIDTNTETITSVKGSHIDPKSSLIYRCIDALHKLSDTEKANGFPQGFVDEDREAYSLVKNGVSDIASSVRNQFISVVYSQHFEHKNTPDVGSMWASFDKVSTWMQTLNDQQRDMFEETIRAKDREVFHEDCTYQHLHAYPESLHLPEPEEFLAQQIFTNPSVQANKKHLDPFLWRPSECDECASGFAAPGKLYRTVQELHPLPRTSKTLLQRFGIDRSKLPKTPQKSSRNLLRSSPKSPAEIWESNASAEVFTTSSEGWEPEKLPMTRSPQELFAHSRSDLLRRSGRRF
ncbi:hypothetical protein CROQUDRAFT_111658 [Cronartium quercuum f. sp. fusiforme G11]|uniref:Uncharacterized protein n=1 Tax=Cronartium quercuum f. sp. fusiforme G11 TaxID=708437 RepID=A0A9P6N5P7_9BASI|nr:hypothetical protein CROQUDRAFT_111658 [Cronartium quercuum f. sp. fusiforme G11]